MTSTILSTILSGGIIGAKIMCHNGSLGIKLAHLLFFMFSPCHFGVLIKIHEYSN